MTRDIIYFNRAIKPGYYSDIELEGREDINVTSLTLSELLNVFDYVNLDIPVLDLMDLPKDFTDDLVKPEEVVNKLEQAIKYLNEVRADGLLDACGIRVFEGDYTESESRKQNAINRLKDIINYSKEDKLIFIDNF